MVMFEQNIQKRFGGLQAQLDIPAHLQLLIKKVYAVPTLSHFFP